MASAVHPSRAFFFLAHYQRELGLTIDTLRCEARPELRTPPPNAGGNGRFVNILSDASCVLQVPDPEYFQIVVGLKANLRLSKDGPHPTGVSSRLSE
jgi:hypothetical protein